MRTVTRQTVTPLKLVSLYREAKGGSYIRLISVDGLFLITPTGAEVREPGALIEHVSPQAGDFGLDLVDITIWTGPRMFTATVDTGWTEFDLVVDLYEEGRG